MLFTGCGLGEMDYTAVLKFMKERKPFIHATLEDTVPENNQQAKEYILQRYVRPHHAAAQKRRKADMGHIPVHISELHSGLVSDPRPCGHETVWMESSGSFLPLKHHAEQQRRSQCQRIQITQQRHRPQ